MSATAPPSMPAASAPAGPKPPGPQPAGPHEARVERTVETAAEHPVGTSAADCTGTPAETGDRKPAAWRLWKQAFVSRRILAMLVLGFSSGLPLGISGTALQAWLTVEGLDLRTIGLFALVGLPYTLKFVWAPLLDRFEPALFGRRVSWIVLLQVALALSCFGIATLDPRTQIGAIAAIAVGIAFLSASQDIVFDAYRADLLRPEERGAGAAVSVLGYRLAMLVSGGVALIVADRWLGWPGTFQALGLVMGLLAIVTLAWPRLQTVVARTSVRAEWVGFLALVATGVITWYLTQALIDAIGRPERGGIAALALDSASMLATGVCALVAARKVGFPSFVRPWEAFFARRHAAWLLAFIVLYKLGDAFAGSLTTSFLLRGVGFTQTEVGAINKGVGLITTIIGALAGGAWLSKRPMYGALMVFGVLQAVSNLGYVVLSVLPKSHGLMAGAVGIENFCAGLGTAAFVAFLMALTDRRYSAAQYALLSALSAVGRVYVGPASGVLVERFGWTTFFALTVVAALPALVLLVWLRPQVQALDARRGEPGVAD